MMMIFLLNEPVAQSSYFTWSLSIFVKTSLKFVPKGLLRDNSTLVQVIAWCRIGNKLLPIPMITQFNDEYVSPDLSKLILIPAN